MEAKLIGLGIETFKIALYLSMPMLLASLVAGLAISIFQAVTQINESTLSFVPKLLITIVVAIFTMPWMMNMMIEFTTRMIELIPSFVF